METLIAINGRNYLIKSKKDLQTDGFQTILAKSYYEHKQKRIEKIFCSCRKPNGSRVKLYTIKSKKDRKFHLRTYQEQSKYHNFDCPFNTEGIEGFISEEDNEIVLSSESILFKAGSGDKKSKKDNSKCKNSLSDENTKRKVLSFNHLIFILMDDAYSFAFNKINKEVDRLSGNIEMPSFKDFIKTFYSKFLDCKFKNGKNMRQVLRNHNANFYMGIINYVDIKPKYVILKTHKGKFKVDKEIWEKAIKYIKIKSNMVSPPYFYLTIKKDFVVRLFVFPIAKGKFFIPVESNTERKYVETINKSIYKPLTVAQIKRVLTKEVVKQFYKEIEPDVRPDFFEFDKDKITIIEVYHSDNLKDISYKTRLYEKERMYRSLKSLNNTFDYQLIEIK